MRDLSDRGLITLDVQHPIWHRFFLVAPLLIVGSRDESGAYDLAPIHHALPLGWSSNYFAFVTAPSHATYSNILREKCFTVSFPLPEQLLEVTLAAAPRLEGGEKPSLQALSTFPATVVDGELVEGSYLFLECVLDRVLDGFGENSMIVGRVEAAYVREDAARRPDRDDGDLLAELPLLAFLPPGRYASICESFAFPFHEGFSR